MIIKSNFPNLDIPQVNFAKLMLDRIKSNKEKKAIVSFEITHIEVLVKNGIDYQIPN